MDCPVCKSSAMVVLEFDEVEVDYCLECVGIWLDAGELELLLDDASGAAELLSSFKPLRDCDEEKRRCPICLKKMRKIIVSADRDPVIIDSCAKGHGIWFERGELGAVVSKAVLDGGSRIQKFLTDIFGEDADGGES